MKPDVKTQTKHAREIVQTAIERLKPAPDNPRTHPVRQLKLLARSIKKFGFIAPVLIDQSGQIVAGQAGRSLRESIYARKRPIFAHLF